MDRGSSRLTVYFEEPFWIGVFERIWDGRLSVCRVTFGAEPKDYQVYEFLQKAYDCLRFSPAVAVSQQEGKKNPKRRAREVHRQMQETGICTRSQQALNMQREQIKTERQTISREQREERKEQQFLLKQQKKKEKHRGR